VAFAWKGWGEGMRVRVAREVQEDVASDWPSEKEQKQWRR
jgi:hypothetical protein